MGKLKQKSDHNLYLSNYTKQKGGGLDFPVYQGKGGGTHFPIYQGHGGGLGSLIGRLIKPIMRTLGPTIKNQGKKLFKKHAVPLVKHVGKRVLEKSSEEMENVLKGRKKFKHAVRDVGKTVKKETIKKMKGGRRFKNSIKSVNKPVKNDIFSKIPTI